MKKFKASELNERIEIKRETEVEDGYGGYTVTESSVATRWANVYAPRARDGVIAMADTVTISYEVTIRSDMAVQHDDIILWHGERLRVKDYRLIQDRQYLSILCKTEVV